MRNLRKQYETIAKEREPDVFQAETPEDAEVINAVSVAKRWYREMIMEAEIVEIIQNVKGVRGA